MMAAVQRLEVNEGIQTNIYVDTSSSQTTNMGGHMMLK
jgi:hypothetical protein